MEDNVKKVMDFIARIAFCEIDSYQYEKFLESIKNKIENELEWLTTHKVQPKPPKADSENQNK